MTRKSTKTQHEIYYRSVAYMTWQVHPDCWGAREESVPGARFWSSCDMVLVDGQGCPQSREKAAS